MLVFIGDFFQLYAFALIIELFIFNCFNLLEIKQ